MTKLTLACGLALSLSLMACASTSNPTSAAPAAGTSAATAQASTKPKLVCEETKPLGSNLPQRICMTPEEAAQRQRAAQDRMRQLQNQSAEGPGMGSSSGG
ncbi:MAG TPA: hypothetical protein VLV87_11890 [Gammaproteobacteria bacterium]|nr:hypothetical protein [Gammaproteobacteria bacterium]